jgi:hypothetical protein
MRNVLLRFTAPAALIAVLSLAQGARADYVDFNTIASKFVSSGTYVDTNTHSTLTFTPSTTLGAMDGSNVTYGTFTLALLGSPSNFTDTYTGTFDLIITQTHPSPTGSVTSTGTLQGTLTTSISPITEKSTVEIKFLTPVTIGNTTYEIDTPVRIPIPTSTGPASVTGDIMITSAVPLPATANMGLASWVASAA